MCGCLLFAITKAQFSVSSTAFIPGGNIPAKYTAFNGQNVNPPIAWSNKPAGTQSFLLVMFDRTFCGGRPDTVCRSHWIVKDIPATATGIAEGISSTGPLPSGAVLGKSDNAIHGTREYTGPFPDSTTIHLYEFKLYALNTATLDCVTPFYNYCLQKAIAGKVIGTASLYGYYLPKPFIVLPVSFVSIEAACTNEKISCKWSTAAESNDADSFIVQRSDDGNNFVSVGAVACTRNTNTLHEYAFEDSSNHTGLGYYRIKQTDRDGTFQYSQIAYGKCTVIKRWLKITPNPTTDKFIINFVNEGNKNLQLLVYDISGKLIYNYQAHQSAGTIEILANAQAGTYLLKAILGDGGETITEKLVKLK